MVVIMSTRGDIVLHTALLERSKKNWIFLHFSKKMIFSFPTSLPRLLVAVHVYQLKIISISIYYIDILCQSSHCHCSPNSSKPSTLQIDIRTGYQLRAINGFLSSSGNYTLLQLPKNSTFLQLCFI